MRVALSLAAMLLVVAPAVVQAQTVAGFEGECSSSRRLGCAAGPRVGWRFEHGEVHVSALQDFRAGPRLQVGLELGTPYFPLGGPTSGGSFALRGHLDGMLLSDPRTGALSYGLRATFGPHVRWLSADHKSEIEVSMGVGVEWMPEPGVRLPRRRPGLVLF